MTVPQILMQPVILACLLIIAFGDSDAWSQGATGGSLGNDNKSLSGSSSEPRAAKPARRERSEPRAAPARSGAGDGSVARFDGRWRMNFTGQSKICAGITADSTFTISGGRTNDGSTVNSSGAFQGVANTGGVSAVLTGRLSGRSGSGAMQMSNGCSGRWTASKQ